jgi:hypothetical protein
MRRARIYLEKRLVGGVVEADELVVAGQAGPAARIPLAEARLAAPLEPKMIVAPGPRLGRGVKAAHREFYLKPASSVLPPRGAIPRRSELGLLSYRAQLGIRLRPTDRWTPAVEILDRVLELVLAAEVMSIERLGVGWEGTMWHVRYGEGAAFDGACALGPWTVTPDELRIEEVELSDAWGAWAVQPAEVAEFLAYVNRWLPLGPDVLVLAGAAHGPELLLEGGQPSVIFGAAEPRIAPGGLVSAHAGVLGEIGARVEEAVAAGAP